MKKKIFGIALFGLVFITVACVVDKKKGKYSQSTLALRNLDGAC